MHYSKKVGYKIDKIASKEKIDALSCEGMDSKKFLTKENFFKAPYLWYSIFMWGRIIIPAASIFKGESKAIKEQSVKHNIPIIGNDMEIDDFIKRCSKWYFDLMFVLALAISLGIFLAVLKINLEGAFGFGIIFLIGPPMLYTFAVAIKTKNLRDILFAENIKKLNYKKIIFVCGNAHAKQVAQKLVSNFKVILIRRKDAV